MFEHTFYASESDVVRSSSEKAFGKLGPVEKMEPSKFELPITSLRRILGERFYDLKDGDQKGVDILHIICFDNGGFNMNDLLSNYEKGAELTKFLNTLFDGFIQMAPNQQVTAEYADRKVGKLCITSESKGLQSFELSLNDLKEIASFGSNGAIIGLKNIREIINVEKQINDNDMSYRRLQVTGDQKALQALDESRKEYANLLSKMQNEIIESFQKFIIGLTDIDFNDVFDVTFLFQREIKNESRTRTIVTLGVVNYHDAASRNVVILNNKFHLTDVSL